MANIDKPVKEKKVLVVDDSLVSQFFIINILKAKGKYEIFAANDGETGLKKIKEYQPDFVILDHYMPEMTGLDVLKEMKRQGINIPVIFATASLKDELKAQCIELGVFDFLKKPFKKEDLFDLLNKMQDEIVNPSNEVF